MSDSRTETVITYEPDNSIRKGYASIASEIVNEIADNAFLTGQLFRRDFSAMHKQSVIGVLWIFIMPIFSVATFLVLTRAGIFSIGSMQVPYPLYAMAGMGFWQLFAAGLIAASSTLTEAGPMITKINFSKKSLVLASTGKSLVAFVVQLGLVAGLIAWYRYPLHPGLLAIPLVTAPVVLLSLGLGFLLALMNAVMRDVGNILAIVLTFLMFLTPVLYAKTATGVLALVTEFNPMYHFVTAGRNLVLLGSIPDMSGFLLSSLFALLVFIVGLVIFHLTETRIAERV